MFIKVKTLSYFKEPVLYSVPKEWTTLPVPGTVITVPMRNKTISGIVTEVLNKKPNVPFEIREAAKIQAFPNDPFYFSFTQKLADYMQVSDIEFLKRVQSFFKHKPEAVPLTEAEQTSDTQKVMLTSEQQAVVDYIAPQIITPTFCPTVLHGVTGSGKTEVYKKLIAQSFLQNKTTILLLPEVALAVQFERILKEQLSSDIPIVSFHSATSAKNRKLLWANLLNKKPQLIIGVHLPILLPLPNLGLIIIDEEHEVGYQEKKHPKVNSKDAALMRAQLHGIPIILGSATPSLTTLHNVKTRGWKLFQLKKRFAGAFPKVHFVNLLDKKQRKNFWLSEKLLNALKLQLQKKEQTLLFLNRRGVSFFVQCKSCSFVFCCKSCSVSLTPHADISLRCHYCGHKEQQPMRCPECKDTEFLNKGIGTQQIVTILKKLLPSARVARADLDTTINRTTWQKTLKAFEGQKLDILVGTQTITKGYHFPNVTLVGILWGDINLNFPVYNAQETTLQQLVQVAGRAGRMHPESSVIVQSMNNHPVFEYVNELDYLKFYEQEIKERKEVNYPPLTRFAEIELKHSNEKTVETESTQLVFELMNNETIQVLGPAQPPVAKIKKVFSRKLFIKSQSFVFIKNAYASINHKEYKSRLYFTPNPQS